jgi:hypothetical protein
MKAMVDGMRSMIYASALWSDLALEMPEGKEKEHYQNLVEFITPIIKAYCSDMGFRVCETAMQCYGGYGYCCDYPIEQYLRDVKILSLYEGTNGIQSMDLMGRKMTIRDGRPFEAFQNEISLFCNKNMGHAELGDKIRALKGVTEILYESATELTDRMRTDPSQWASYSYPALTAFGEVFIVWRLLDMAVIAHPSAQKKGKKYDYHRGKIMQATYFAGITLPHTMATIETFLRNGREVTEIPDNAF